jgi:phosphatidylinositol phospholipase C delta
VALDLGVTINHAMFERNGRVGYVLKPLALRDLDSPGAKEALLRPPSRHMLDIKLLSAQQLPQGKKSLKDSLLSAGVVDPYVEISIHVPDWSAVPFRPSTPSVDGNGPVSYETGPTGSGSAGGAPPGKVATYKSAPVKNNGFNPVWEEKCSLPFELVGGRERGMMDLVFVKFAVRDDGDDEDDTPIAVFCASLGSLREGECFYLD